MRSELPVLERFLFCFPLRYFLVSWGYISMISVIYELYSYVHKVISITLAEGYNDKATLQCIFLQLTIIEFVLTIIFIIGIHKKNVKLLRIYYFGALSLWILYVMRGAELSIYCMYYIYLCFVHSMAQFHPSSFTWTFGMIIAHIFTRILVIAYVLLLVRSELIIFKRRSYEIQFVNNAAESICKMNFVKETADKDEETQAICEEETRELKEI